ncbi:hypothetical protein WKI65_36850 [Streptomyces sp. MS1.AVA.3]|uniref:hypothetical protein n=1 Tax=Streptomyces decoyicus TaxID=249567 RepID=UPI0030BEA06B
MSKTLDIRVARLAVPVSRPGTVLFPSRDITMRIWPSTTGSFTIDVIVRRLRPPWGTYYGPPLGPGRTATSDGRRVTPPRLSGRARHVPAPCSATGE